MFAISFREFKNLFKSVRSIIIIIVIWGVTLGAAKLVSNFQNQLQQIGLGESAYASGLMVLTITAIPLFVFSLSHNAINEEIKSRTIRFIATKTSRDNILLGKFLGILFFWITCLFIAVLLITLFSKDLYILKFIQSIIFISYFIGLTILLSTVIPKPTLTIFISIVLAIAAPILGIWSVMSNNIFLKIYSYITPYFYYSQDEAFYTYLVLIFPMIFLGLSLIIMRKRDL